MYMYTTCVQYSQWPEEGIREPGTEITDCCTLSGMSAGS